MLLPILCVLFAFFGSSQAHFSIEIPYWRGESGSRQWERPCGGVNQSVSHTNRTRWPLDGGSLVFEPTHTWAYTFVNLGLGGDNTTNFNISLVEGFNQTGNGTFCFPRLVLPAGLPVSDGTNASIQVVQVNERGSALYNCADITFSADAQTLGADACLNSTGVGGSSLTSESTASSSGGGSSAQSSASATSTGAGARGTAMTGLTMLAIPAALALHLI